MKMMTLQDSHAVTHRGLGKLIRWARANAGGISQRELAQLLHPGAPDIEAKRQMIANYESDRLRVPESILAQIERALELRPGWRDQALLGTPVRGSAAPRIMVPLAKEGVPIRNQWVSLGSHAFGHVEVPMPQIPASQGPGMPQAIAIPVMDGIVLVGTDLSQPKGRLLVVTTKDGVTALKSASDLAAGDTTEGVALAYWRELPDATVTLQCAGGLPESALENIKVCQGLPRSAK